MMDQRKKIIIIIAIFAVLSILAIIIAIVINANQPDTNPPTQTDINQNSYTDPDSGVEVGDPDGWQQGEPSGELVVIGFSELLNSGLSSAQFAQFQGYLADFASSTKIDNQDIYYISLVAGSLQISLNTDNNQKDMSASIRINKQHTRWIKLSYIGVNDLLLRIYDKQGGSVIYTSPYDE